MTKPVARASETKADDGGAKAAAASGGGGARPRMEDHTQQGGECQRKHNLSHRTQRKDKD